jgi:hypothetical protein
MEKMKIRSSVVFLLVVLPVCGQGLAQDKPHIGHEQLQFSVEDEGVKKPVDIPDDVLAILIKDELVHNVLQYTELPVGKIPQDWFSAAAIHLSTPDKADLLVVGEGPLRGANVTTFWLFNTTPNGHELVLRAIAHELNVKKTVWKEYREIELLNAAAYQASSVLLRWDGKQYAAYLEKIEPTW